jgi:Flp pilus assembly protein TadD
MSLPCDTSNRLAGPVGTTPVQWVPPPGPPPSQKLPPTSFLEPGESAVPGYLAVARAQAKTASGSATALARLAQAELSAGDVEAAVSAAIEALDQAGDAPDSAAEFAAVQVLRAGGAAETARAHMGATVSEDEVGRSVRARLAIECDDLDDARALVSGATTFDGLVMGGWLAMRESQYSRAVALFRRATRVVGPTPDVLINTGYSYAALGHPHHAINATRQAQALAPHRRLIAFNLVNFYLAVGNYDAAAGALESLRQHYPDDVEIALALAHIALRAGDRERAHRILQRARTSTSWVSAPLIRRAELESNLAVLRWVTGERSLAATRKIVLGQLALSDYQSLPMASLLPGLLPNFSDHEQLATLLERFEAHHDPNTLLFLRVHDAILRRDERAAVSLAEEWAKNHPFSPVAAALAIQLIGALGGESDRAIDLGFDALTRAPADALLVNNLAYALALAGRGREARVVLRKVTTPEPAPALLATRGLVEMVSGNITAGIEGYESARELATKQGNERLAGLATLNLQLALRRLDSGAVRGLDVDVRGAASLPRSAEDDPAVWLLAKRIEHEGIQVEWGERGDRRA